MPKVQAWQCRHTGKLFTLDDVGAYRAHSRAFLQKQKREQKIELRRRDYATWFKVSTFKLESLSEIFDWYTTNVRRICEFNLGNKINKDFAIVDLQIGNIVYSESASNTHCAPRGKETNWGRSKEKQRGYRGFTFRIAFNTEGKNPVAFISDIFKFASIHTGGGGSGSTTDSQYQVTIWIDDWPGLQRNIEEQHNEWTTELEEYNISHSALAVVAKLKGVPHPYKPPKLKIKSK